MRHPSRDKSATAVRKCAMPRDVGSRRHKKMKPPTRIPEMSPRALEAKMKHNMKNVVVMVLWVLWLNTAWSDGLGTPVGTTDRLRLRRQNRWPRPRSRQGFRNNGPPHLPDPMASRRKLPRSSRSPQTTPVLTSVAKPPRFSRSPPRKLQISSLTSYVFNRTLNVSEILK